MVDQGVPYIISRAIGHEINLIDAFPPIRLHGILINQPFIHSLIHSFTFLHLHDKTSGVFFGFTFRVEANHDTFWIKEAEV